MPAPEYIRRSYAGGAQPAQLNNSISSTATSFSIAVTTGWVEEDGSPLGTAGPFTVAIDLYTPSVEKVLCSSVDLTTGLVTVYVAGDGWSGRGYDGTIPQAHVPGSSTSGVQPCWSSVEADEANQAVYDLLGGGGGGSLTSVPIGALVPFAGTGLTVPPNFLVANGASLLRTSYSACFATLTIAFTGTTTSGGATITSVSSTVTPYMFPGLSITLANSGGAIYTVQSTTSTTVTLTSGVGITAGSGGNCTGFPHGVVDSTHFNIPDASGRVLAGQGTEGTNASPTLFTGAVGGEQLHTLVTGELASHAHGTNESPHTHYANGGGNSALQAVFANGSGGTYLNGTAGSPSYSVEWALNQTITPTSTGLTIQNTGSGTGHNNMQPYVVITHIVRVS